MTHSQSIKDRTLVLVCSRGNKGTRIIPSDFLPALACVRGSIEAFGTVGVGYVWHITLSDTSAADVLLSQGNFSIREVQVSISRLSKGFFQATLHWIPYWVPDRDVESVFSTLLSSPVTCTYIRVPQVGFLDCFSTQRAIQSVVSLEALPHFLYVTSEGVSYKSCLFVPGRVPVCFACHQPGHMRGQCTSKAAISAEGATGPEDVPDVGGGEMEGDVTEEDVDSEVHDPKLDPNQYRVLRKEDDEMIPLTSKGCTLAIHPGLRTSRDLDELERLTRTCNKDACGWLAPFMKGQISVSRMEKHFVRGHLRKFALELCSEDD